MGPACPGYPTRSGTHLCGRCIGNLGKIETATEPMSTKLTPERLAQRIRTAYAFIAMAQSEKLRPTLMGDANISTSFMMRVALPYSLAGMDIGGVLERTERLAKLAGINPCIEVATLVVGTARTLRIEAERLAAATSEHREALDIVNEQAWDDEVRQLVKNEPPLAEAHWPGDEQERRELAAAFHIADHAQDFTVKLLTAKRHATALEEALTGTVIRVANLTLIAQAIEKELSEWLLFSGHRSDADPETLRKQGSESSVYRKTVLRVLSAFGWTRRERADVLAALKHTAVDDSARKYVQHEAEEARTRSKPALLQRLPVERAPLKRGTRVAPEPEHELAARWVERATAIAVAKYAQECPIELRDDECCGGHLRPCPHFGCRFNIVLPSMHVEKSRHFERVRPEKTPPAISPNDDEDNGEIA